MNILFWWFGEPHEIKIWPENVEVCKRLESFGSVLLIFLKNLFLSHFSWVPCILATVNLHLRVLLVRSYLQGVPLGWIWHNLLGPFWEALEQSQFVPNHKWYPQAHGTPCTDPAVSPTVNTSPFSRMTYCFLPLSLFLSVGRLRHFPARAESEGAGLHRHLLQVQGAAGGDYQVRLPWTVLRTRVGTTCSIPFLTRVDCFTEIMISHFKEELS